MSRQPHNCLHCCTGQQWTVEARSHPELQWTASYLHADLYMTEQMGSKLHHFLAHVACLKGMYSCNTPSGYSSKGRDAQEYAGPAVGRKLKVGLIKTELFKTNGCLILASPIWHFVSHQCDAVWMNRRTNRPYRTLRHSSEEASTPNPSGSLHLSDHSLYSIPGLST